MERLTAEQNVHQQPTELVREGDQSRLRAENAQLEKKCILLEQEIEVLKRGSRDRDHHGPFSQGVIDKLNAQLQQASGEVRIL